MNDTNRIEPLDEVRGAPDINTSTNTDTLGENAAQPIANAANIVDQRVNSGDHTNQKKEESATTQAEDAAPSQQRQWLVTRSDVLYITNVVALLIIVVVVTAVYVTKAAMEPHVPSTADKLRLSTPSHPTVNRENNNLLPVRESTPTPDPRCKVDFRLPTTMVPVSYDLVLKVDLDDFVFTRSVTIKVSVKQTTDCVLVNVKSLAIDRNKIVVKDMISNRVFRLTTSYEITKYQIYILKLDEQLQANKNYTIRFGGFTGSIKPDLFGLYKSSYVASDGTTRYLATSQLETTSARKVFPCFDEPQLKAIFAVTLIHRTEYTGLSNMPVAKSDTIEKGWMKDEFEITLRMSSYLLAFVVSDFVYKETHENNLRIRFWSEPAKVNHTLFAMDYSVKTYKYFGDYFGIPEPLTKVDHVAVPTMVAKAMENWGLITYSEESVLYDEKVSTSHDKFMITVIVAHEICHTWFGNIVTMKWWTDLWLNEGFASMASYFAIDHVFPNWNVYDLRIVQYIFPVMIDDALDTSHPISTPINDPDELQQYFDGITYHKGTAVLRMVRNFMGWDVFKQGLQNYIAKYKFKNAEMSQLWAVFTHTVHGRIDISGIMDTWTKQMGYPVVMVTSRGNTYHLEQQRFLLDSDTGVSGSHSQFGYKWFIPFTYRTQHSSQSHLLWLNLTSASIPKPPSGWIIGNVDVYGFYLVNYDESMWKTLAAQLNTDHTVFSQSNRAALINNAFILARSGRLKYNLALDMTTFLKNEISFVPWAAFSGPVKFLHGMLSDTHAYGLLQEYIKKLVSPLFHGIQLDRTNASLLDSYMDATLFQLSCFVRLESATKIAHKRFQDWMLNGIKIPSDFAQAVYSVGIHDGGIHEWEFVWNKSVDASQTNPRERSMMTNALASTKIHWLLWRYIEWIFDPTKIAPGDVWRVLTAMVRYPTSNMIMRAFLMRDGNWQRIVVLLKHSTMTLNKAIIPRLTEHVNTDLELRQYEKAFKDFPTSVTNSAKTGLALIKANVQWMKSGYPSVVQWLQTHIHTI